jgi:hypothetical protein
MRPTDREVRRILARSMITRVAVRAPDGRPFLTPYWFVTDDSRICITTGRNALLARYIDTDPRVVLLFEPDRDGAPAEVLRLTGTGRVHAGVPRSLRLLARIAAKYILSPGGLRCEIAHLHLLKLRRRFYAQSEPAWIEVVPETARLIGGDGS